LANLAFHGAGVNSDDVRLKTNTGKVMRRALH
jgi:hypothetical protein